MVANKKTPISKGESNNPSIEKISMADDSVNVESELPLRISADNYGSITGYQHCSNAFSGIEQAENLNFAGNCLSNYCCSSLNLFSNLHLFDGE